MKKWQIITLSIIGLVLVVAISLGTYFYISGLKSDQSDVKPAVQTQEEKDLEAAKTSLDDADDLDLTELDTTLKDLESIDLSGV